MRSTAGATLSVALLGCFDCSVTYEFNEIDDCDESNGPRVGATPLATLGDAPGKTSFSPEIKTTATSAVVEEVGANGLEPSTSRM